MRLYGETAERNYQVAYPVVNMRHLSEASCAQPGDSVAFSYYGSVV